MTVARAKRYVSIDSFSARPRQLRRRQTVKCAPDSSLYRARQVHARNSILVLVSQFRDRLPSNRLGSGLVAGQNRRETRRGCGNRGADRHGPPPRSRAVMAHIFDQLKCRKRYAQGASHDRRELLDRAGANKLPPIEGGAERSCVR